MTFAGGSSEIVSIVASTLVPSPQGLSGSLLQQHRTPSSSSNSLSLSRAGLVWTATVAVSLLLMQWIGQNKEGNRRSRMPLDWLTRLLSQVWTEPSTSSSQQPWTSDTNTAKCKTGSDKKEGDEQRPHAVLLHRGSCHCGSITFKLSPAREFHVVQSPQSGKLQYPTARVPADQLHLISGKHLWNTYHVQDENDGSIWAYSFCRQCAIHLLHATDADQSSLFVNLQCFNVETSQANSGLPATKVPIPHHEDDSVAGRGSVISTVTAGTQKSFLTTVTSLPEYANPRVFGQQRSASLPSANDSESESGVHSVDLPPRSSRRRNRLPSLKSSPNQSSQSKVVSDSRESPMIVPRGVLANTPSSGAIRYSSGGKSTPFCQPKAPVAEWPVRDDEDDIVEGEADDEDGSISSHSAATRDGMDYPSTSSTMEGNTAASTAANSSASSNMGYDIAMNRERMLQNMRKHLKVTPAKRT